MSGTKKPIYTVDQRARLALKWLATGKTTLWREALLCGVTVARFKQALTKHAPGGAGEVKSVVNRAEKLPLKRFAPVAAVWRIAELMGPDADPVELWNAGADLGLSVGTLRTQLSIIKALRGGKQWVGETIRRHRERANGKTKKKSSKKKPAKKSAPKKADDTVQKQNGGEK